MKSPAFLFAAAASLFLVACASAPKVAPRTLPNEPGLGACTTTIRTAGRTGTIRALHDGLTTREIVDLDGDGQPEAQRVITRDAQGRVAQIDETSPDGATVLSRETRTWDGLRLQRRVTDRLLADGTPGVDGVADETVTLSWLGDELRTEEVDQVDAAGLQGVDGKADIVTTWTYENGARVRGRQADARDDTVLRLDELSWDGGRLVKQAVDLGGDGEVDITMSNTWSDARVVAVRVEGNLEATDIAYDYCQ